MRFLRNESSVFRVNKAIRKTLPLCFPFAIGSVDFAVESGPIRSASTWEPDDCNWMAQNVSITRDGWGSELCRLPELDYYSVIFKLSLKDNDTAVTLLDIQSVDNSSLVVTLDNCDGVLTVDFGRLCGGSYDIDIDQLLANEYLHFSLEVTPDNFSIYWDCDATPIFTSDLFGCPLGCSSLEEHQTAISVLRNSSGCSGTSVGKVNSYTLTKCILISLPHVLTCK